MIFYLNQIVLKSRLIPGDRHRLVCRPGTLQRSAAWTYIYGAPAWWVICKGRQGWYNRQTPGSCKRSANGMAREPTDFRKDHKYGYHVF